MASPWKVPVSADVGSYVGDFCIIRERNGAAFWQNALEGYSFYEPVANILFTCEIEILAISTSFSPPGEFLDCAHESEVVHDVIVIVVMISTIVGSIP